MLKIVFTLIACFFLFFFFPKCVSIVYSWDDFSISKNLFSFVFQLTEYNDTNDSAKITDYDPKTWKNYSTSMEIVSAKDKIIFEKNITNNNVTGKVTVSVSIILKN